MSLNRIGLHITARDAVGALAAIEDAERRHIPAVWMTTGGAGLDALTLLAAAAVRTDRVLLGTSITPTWPRHPIAVAQQTQALAQLAPGRFRLGVGPSHKSGIESTFGIDFSAPLGHLREYLRILKSLLQQGEVEFEGRYYQARASLAQAVEVPVMASALRRKSFELCGAEADGAISWVCPSSYLRDTALPAIHEGASGVSRTSPPLIAHVPVCVHDNPGEVRVGARDQIGNYPRTVFYQQMFSDAGFPESFEGSWSDAMLEAVLFSGNENLVAERLKELISFGATEIIVTPVTAGEAPEASLDRTLSLLSDLARDIEKS